MPLDAICLQAVTAELLPQITGSRIEKIQQPARDQVVLLLRGGRRLLLCAGGGQPRIQLTEQLRDNPAQPPMFCMLLRKHLSGGVIQSLTQEPLERVVTLTVLAADELGERSAFRLVLETVNRRANLILLDKDGRIIDCMRRVDFEINPDRQVLPGLFYRLPAPVEKQSPLAVTEGAFASLLAAAPADKPLDGWLVETFNALSPLVARELVYRAFDTVDAEVSEGKTLWPVLAEWQQRVEMGAFVPTLIKRSGVPSDFTYQPTGQYESAAETEVYDSFSHLLDDFFEKREQAERVKQKGQDLLKTANTAAARIRRKIAAQEKELLDCRDRDRWRVCGELITANLYRMERGQSKLTAQNYYDPDCKEMDIPLDVRLSPQENAAKYFKKYSKAKTAEKYLTEQLDRGRQELRYLESVLQEIALAESEQDFNDIRTELTEGGYLRRAGKKVPFQRPSRPREFRSTAGLRILVGRNNRQNDRLTGKDAEKWDIWLHTQKIHGSHVILCTGGETPDEGSLLEAAMLAAYFSQAQTGTKVPVDYTPVKFVKKPAASRPGMVVYTTYQTMYVDPNEELVKRLRVK